MATFSPAVAEVTSPAYGTTSKTWSFIMHQLSVQVRTSVRIVGSSSFYGFIPHELLFINREVAIAERTEQPVLPEVKERRPLSGSWSTISKAEETS